MFFTTHALLIPVIFLCGLEEAVLAQYGHCAGDRCYAVFQKPVNYSGAQTSCRGSGGQLLDFTLERVEKTFASIPRAIRGRFWLSSSNSTVPQLCSSISVAMDGHLMRTTARCPDELDGHLCQYTVEGSCSSIHAGEGPQMRYVTHAGFEVKDSETFPMGTIATDEKLGAEYPDSKHVCYMGIWINAPWVCEVFNGGCEHSCNLTTYNTPTCMCPAGQHLHPNNITCTKGHGTGGAQGWQQEGDSYLLNCTAGYRLAQDGKSCVDVDECKERNPCTGESEECLNTQGGFVCGCIDDFVKEDGLCVNVSICDKCEHMLCEKFNGIYECKCREGFRVSPQNPINCEQHCTKRDCPATCDPNTASEKEDMRNCFCPDGYIRDARDNEIFCTDIDECEQQEQCNHKCENLFGSFRCLCDEGYKLHNDYMCLPADTEGEDTGSGASPSYPTPPDAHPATVPFYIKTGSVMGITMFILLSAGLLYFLGRNMAKRCGKFELTSIKGRDIDIFYLQHMTTDTYKRLSFDKQFKNDSQRV